MIKWEPLIQSLQNLVGISPCHACLAIFFRKISNAFYPSLKCYLPHLRNGWSNWCESKRKWVNWMLRWLGYLWTWPLTLTLNFQGKMVSRGWEARLSWNERVGNRKDALMWNTKEMGQNWTLRWVGYLWPWPLTLKVKLYLGNGKPDCHGTKGMGVDRMTWCETSRKWVTWMPHWLGYLWPWPLTFKVKLYFGNGRPDWMGVDRMPSCETKPLCDLEAEDTVRDRGDLRCRRFRRLI